MHVAHLLDSLAFGPDVEIIEARLPNLCWLGVPRLGFGPLPARPRHDRLRVELLYQLHHFGWVSLLRFADQDMEMIWAGGRHLRREYNASCL